MKGRPLILACLWFLPTVTLAKTEIIEREDLLSCGEFEKVFNYVTDQHLRFFIDPNTDKISLVKKAAETTPDSLRALGFNYLAPLAQKYLARLPIPQVDSAQLPSILCSYLSPSIYRAAFLKSYLKALDPYSDFYLTEELDTRTSVVDGDFVGVGISTDPSPDFLTVSSVVEDGPSYGKLMEGDKIYKVDGHPVATLTDLEVRQRIRGAKGTKVSFWVSRGDEWLTIEIMRDRVQQRSVTAEMIDDRFLQIKVSRFYRQTPYDVERAIQTHQKQMKGIILDLRDNPGGLLQAARDLVDLFISSGVVVYLKGKDFEEQVWAMREGGYTQFPLVVLVNEGTASAAEITAGALQDYGRALVVGQKTYGKGSVQNVYDTKTTLNMNYRGGFKMTTLFYYLPSGRNVDRLMPDLLLARASSNEKIEHPEMPYRGPSVIPVAGWNFGAPRTGFAVSHPKTLQAIKAAEREAINLSVEEVGRSLLRKMQAGR